MPTPQMNLTLPVVLGTAGPTYASQLNAALTTIDSHNHTTGQGVPITPAAMSINAALPFGNNPATGLRLLGLADQASAPSGGVYPRCIYSLGGDLWFLNAAGNAVKITSGTALNPAGVGGFTGDYATAGAQAVYSSSQSRYTFQNPDASLADLYLRGANLTQGLAVGGASTLTGAVNAAASLSVGTTLGVAGASTLTGTVTAQGALSANSLGVATTSTFTGNVTASAALSAGSLSVGGTSQLTGAVTTTGSVAVGTTLTATSGTFSNGLAVNGANLTGNQALVLSGVGASSLGGALSVAGNLSGSAGTLSNGLTVNGANITGNQAIALSGTGASSLGGALTVAGALTASASVASPSAIFVTEAIRNASTSPTWGLSRSSAASPPLDWSLVQSSTNNDLTLGRANNAASATVRVAAPIELQQASTISAVSQVASGITQTWGTVGGNQTTITDGIVIAPKVQSINGVRLIEVDMGFLMTSGGATYAGVAPGRTVFNSTGSVAARSLRLYVVKYTGSITAMSAYISGQAIPASNSMTVAYQRNSGTAVTLATWTSANGSGVQPFSTFTKNSFAVTAGEVLNLVITTTYSCTATVTFDMTIESDVR